MAVSEAADILGITNVDWNIEFSVKEEVKEESLQSEIPVSRIADRKENDADINTSLGSHNNKNMMKKTKQVGPTPESNSILKCILSPKGF